MPPPDDAATDADQNGTGRAATAMPLHPPTQITITAAHDSSSSRPSSYPSSEPALPSPAPLTPRASAFRLPEPGSSNATHHQATPTGSFTAPTSPTAASAMFRTNTIGATADPAIAAGHLALDRSVSAQPDLGGGDGLGISALLSAAASGAATNGTATATANASTAAASASGGTKETWKRRKQVLLADAKDHTVADLQLHGLRPPPYSYHPHYQNSSILGQTVGQLTAHTASTSTSTSTSASRDTNHATYASSRTAILRPDDPHVRNDIIRMIDQWLADEGFGATRQLLMEEAGIKRREREEAGLDARKLRGHILEGDWPEVDKLLQKPLVKNHKAFLYAVYKQQFLEHIEHREFQKGFTFLNKRLKPLEHYQPHPSEFRDLCYLLSAKAVTDAPSFAAWEGIQPAREKLVMEFAAMLEQDWLEKEAGLPGSGSAGGGVSAANAVPGSKASTSGYTYVPPHRLLTMLHQAVAYQVEFARYHPKKAPVISGLLHDYTGFIVPNAVAHTMRGHRKNVKSVRFVGEEGRKIVSGSSDNTVRLWNANTGRCEGVLQGHRSRVWDVDSTRTGGHVASASGDSTVKVWDVESGQCRTTLRAGVGDVYSCRFHPDERHIVSAGYDKLVRMYDVETGSIVKTFTGHQLGVSSAIFNPLGNLIVTASKDTTIRFWDVVSGLCIRTITGHLGEVTSVEINETGSLLLSSSKDNSNRLWDLRMLRPLKRFKGHQNTSKNFIRSSFAHTSLLVGGSEDGLIYMWDQESSEVLQTLEGHGRDTLHAPARAGLGGHTASGAATATSVVSDLTSLSTNNNVAYGAVWNKAQSLLASCGDDGTVKTWIWDEGRDLEANADLARRSNDDS
ncbi:related to TAF5 - subunit of TFIID and SAGA complexes [Moesziomyces antarcticus]|uniref:WD40 repeat-containing protein SMU1 n=1 Tax=Pseudozyma antarctica TaxID=84753 RepID=A0A5C3FU72_PSEA2|nr:related to TAF5 - subunit of TFIID and SAGA complexes [Moesziomyces antarcticus]